MKEDHVARIKKGIFIVNHKKQIVYLDDTAKQMFPKCHLHDYCYEVMRGQSVNCHDCPILRYENGEEQHQCIYNQQLDAWMSCIVLPIEWPNEGPCVLLSIETPVEYQNLPMNTSVEYDDLFQFEIKKDRFRTLFYDVEKFPKIIQEGKLSWMIDSATDHIIHEEDMLNFKDFWDMETMEKRLLAHGHISENFRVLIANRKYQWMNFYITAASNTKMKDTYVCFMSDMKTQEGSLSESREITEEAFDALTGLLRKQRFEKLARLRLEEDTQRAYGIVDLDIENFKLFNDWYGNEEGDHLLRFLAKQIRKKIEACDGIAMRIGGDEFVLMLPQEYCDVKELGDEIIDWIQKYDVQIKFLPTVGIYLIDDRRISITQMCDRAAIAAKSRKGNYASRVALYQESMMRRIENRQEVLSGVKDGLQNHEFVVYYQPQCSARTKRIIGAEALVRWKHPKRGLLPPSEFIPILESSGFIYRLDYYVWEETCRFLHERLQQGKDVVPISVNVSRMDIFQFSLCEIFIELINRYKLPIQLLEIEITESAYAENFDQLKETVRELREAGFTVLMDDFGSGYSSLNMLNNVELDILKIDMKFLEITKHDKVHNSSILESIIAMGKWLKLRMIAEGVENEEDVDYLLNLDCEYMQGYYFYRPQPEDAFTKILDDEECIDTRGILAERLPNIDLTDLFRKDITSESMLSNILGGIALYEIVDDELHICMVNDRYYRITGCNAVDLKERSTLITKQIYPQDLPVALDIFQRAEKAGSFGASGVFRRYRLNGEIIWLDLRAFFLHKQGNRKLFYGSIRDVSKTVSLQKDMQAVMRTIPGDIFEYHVDENGFQECRVISLGLSWIHGFTRAELQDSLNKLDLRFVDKRDHAIVRKMLQDPLHWADSFSIEYRIQTKQKGSLWVEQHIRYIYQENGIRIYNSLITDITKLKNQEKELIDSQRLLHHLIGDFDAEDTSALTNRNRQYAAYLMAKSFPGGMMGGYCEKDYPIYFANDEMLAFLGYDSFEDFRSNIQGKIINAIYEKDRKRVQATYPQAIKEGTEFNLRYRLYRKDGSVVWVMDRGCVVEGENHRLAVISTCMDIDEIMNAKKELEEAKKDLSFFNSDIPSGYHQCYLEDGYPFRHISQRFLDILGFTRDEIKERFQDSFFNMIVEEDRYQLLNLKQELTNENQIVKRNYRLYSKQGTVWVTNQMKLVKHGKERFLAGLIIDISEMVQLQHQLETIITNTPGDVFSYENGKLAFHSFNLATVVGYDKEEYQRMLKDSKGQSLTDPRDKQYVWKKMKEAYCEHKDIDLIFRTIAKDESVHYTRMKASCSKEEKDTYYGIMMDVTDMKLQEQELEISRQSMQSIIQQANLDIWQYDIPKDTLCLSKEGARLLDMAEKTNKRKLSRCELTSFFAKMADKKGFNDMTYHLLSMLKEHIEQHKTTSILNLSAFSNKPLWIKITSERIYDAAHEPVWEIGYFQNITEEKKKELQIMKEKNYGQVDFLTGAYNRRMGIKLIEQRLLQKKQDVHAVCLLDLDDFKKINDTYGHISGDFVLQKVVQRILDLLTENDLLCRMGGDEFLIYLNRKDKKDIQACLHHIQRSISAISMSESSGMKVHASIGITLYEGAKDTFQSLYQEADEALYEAKNHGKHCYAFYGPNL